MRVDVYDNVIIANYCRPKFVFLPILLNDSSIILKDGGHVQHGGISGLASGEVHQQARFSTFRWTD